MTIGIYKNRAVLAEGERRRLTHQGVQCVDVGIHHQTDTLEVDGLEGVLLWAKDGSKTEDLACRNDLVIGILGQRSVRRMIIDRRSFLIHIDAAVASEITDNLGDVAVQGKHHISTDVNESLEVFQSVLAESYNVIDTGRCIQLASGDITMTWL